MIHVEGIREETLISADHALQVIAAGNEQRKVRAVGSRRLGQEWGDAAGCWVQACWHSVELLGT